MNRNNHLSILPLLLFTLLFTFVGCKDKAPQENSNLTGYEKNRTAHDTAQVIDKLNQFFGYLEEDRITDAVAMLYVLNDSDVYAEPQLLDNDQIPAVTNRFKTIPIVGHRIDYIKFYEAYLNEAKVTAIISEARDGNSELKTHYYFRLYDYLGSWRLCLMNTNNGDQRLISNEQADSLQEKFANDMKSKQNAVE